MCYNLFSQMLFPFLPKSILGTTVIRVSVCTLCVAGGSDRAVTQNDQNVASRQQLAPGSQGWPCRPGLECGEQNTMGSFGVKMNGQLFAGNS